MRYPRPAILADIPLDRHAVIEASAGTGKTYTLEHLVVDRLLRTDLTLDRILVVTFTEKATGELRARIRLLIERILGAAARGEDVGDEGDAWAVDEAARRKLEATLFSFDRASIFTIHAFCRRVLVDLAFDGGQPFEQQRVDGDRLFHGAFRGALREELAAGEETRQVVVDWLASGRDEGALERLLRSAWRAGCLEPGASPAEAVPATLAALRAAFDAGVMHAAFADAAIQKASFARAEGAITQLRDALALEDDAALAALADGVDLDGLLSPRRTAVTPPKRRYPDDLAPRARETLAHLRTLRSLRLQVEAPERRAVDLLLPAVARRLEGAKRREGLFDFDDLLTRVWEGLRGPRGETLVATLRRRYAVALIDEFQDTDGRQWEIFGRLFVGGEGDEATHSFREAPALPPTVEGDVPVPVPVPVPDEDREETERAGAAGGEEAGSGRGEEQEEVERGGRRGEGQGQGDLGQGQGQGDFGQGQGQGQGQGDLGQGQGQGQGSFGPGGGDGAFGHGHGHGHVVRDWGAGEGEERDRSGRGGVERGRSDHTLTVIGDPKQAIYGFRGADVHTYLAAREVLLARGAARVPLRVNFRATPALIDATNALLDQSGRAPLFSGAITYDEPVRSGRPTLQLVDADGQPVSPITLWRFRPPPPRGRNQQSVPAWQLKQAFGRHLGRALGTLLSDPARRPTLVEHAGTADETRRTLTASDVFVLVRTGWEAVDAAGHLRRAGVPYSFYKQEGLFQTPEAWDVYDVLAAIARPHDRAARLRAFATPFFGVPWRELAAWRTLPGNHPALERLHAWRLLAEREQHAALFHALLYDSGILERELFLRDTERELTNAQHILEVLLEVADARRLALPELLALLRRYIDGSEAPEGSDGNTQRLPTEQDAVQIMTMHKSKGLEAPIVCLYGGYSPGWRPDVQTVQDAAGERQVLVGEAALEASAAPLERAAREEDERLLYVALTRAAGQLLLPYVDSSRAVQGTHGPLNRRLAALVDGELPAGFAIEEVDARPPPTPDEAEQRRALGTWRPPAALLTVPDASARYAAARAAHAPLVVTSYTRMKQAREAAAALDLPIEADEFVQDLGAAAEVDDAALPGGRHVGRCLHEAIEALDFAALAAPFDAWRARPEVSEAFDAVMRVHGVEARWKFVAQRLVYDTLTRPVRLGDATVDGLFGCREVRELEFLFPLPESSHPLLEGGDPEGRWQVERGFVKGFVDLVFEHDGRTWWADWKSDTLRTYDPATIEAHVADHYDLQAQLYTLGLVRLLGLRDAEDYAARFGGYLYVFLRGMGEDAPSDHGVYVARPDWAQVVAWERALCDEAVS